MRADVAECIVRVIKGDADAVVELVVNHSLSPFVVNREVLGRVGDFVRRLFLIACGVTYKLVGNL